MNPFISLQDAAGVHWRMLNGGAVTREEFTGCLHLVMGDHLGSPFHYLTRNLPDSIDSSVFQQQLNANEMSGRWRGTFSGSDCIGEEVAREFLIEVYNSLEEVDVLFTNHITPGTTRHRRGHISDFVTRRPNRKLGWSLQLTTHGIGSYNCIKTQLKTHVGDLVLLGPDAFYDYQRDHSCEMWEHLWAYFPQEEGWLDFLQWPELGPDIYYLKSSGQVFEKLKGLFEEINTIHFQDGDYAQVLGKNILEQILIRCRQLAPVDKVRPKDDRINQVTDYISHNFNKPFSLDQLAADVGLSSARLSALFKQEMGTTIINWRDMQRMARASQLLVQTRQSISQIAEAVGYSDPLYFSRCFSRYLHSSPRAYRAAHGKRLQSKQAAKD